MSSRSLKVTNRFRWVDDFRALFGDVVCELRSTEEFPLRDKERFNGLLRLALYIRSPWPQSRNVHRDRRRRLVWWTVWSSLSLLGSLFDFLNARALCQRRRPKRERKGAEEKVGERFSHSWWLLSPTLPSPTPAFKLQASSPAHTQTQIQNTYLNVSIGLASRIQPDWSQYRACGLFSVFTPGIPLPEYSSPVLLSFGSASLRSVPCLMTERCRIPRSTCIHCAARQSPGLMTSRSSALSYSHLYFTRSYNASAFVIIHWLP